MNNNRYHVTVSISQDNAWLYGVHGLMIKTKIVRYYRPGPDSALPAPDSGTAPDSAIPTALDSGTAPDSVIPAPDSGTAPDLL